jgi:hypothetical protein
VSPPPSRVMPRSGVAPLLPKEGDAENLLRPSPPFPRRVSRWIYQRTPGCTGRLGAASTTHPRRRHGPPSSPRRLPSDHSSQDRRRSTPRGYWRAEPQPAVLLPGAGRTFHWKEENRRISCSQPTAVLDGIKPPSHPPGLTPSPRGATRKTRARGSEQAPGSELPQSRDPPTQVSPGSHGLRWPRTQAAPGPSAGRATGHAPVLPSLVARRPEGASFDRCGTI